MSTAPLLRVGGLELRAGGRLLAQGLEFAILPGELWCVLGANGAGKTTLLHALAGLRAPAAGRIELSGRPLHEWPAAQAALRRGFLPQNPGHGFSISALELALLGRYPHLGARQWESEEDLRIARAALARMDLAAQAARDLATLSGGERQRAALAALLAQDPPLFLLDEPLAHLDLRHQIAVMELLASLARNEGRGVMLSLHDASLAARFATHVLAFAGAAAPLCGPAAVTLTEEVLSAAFGHRVRRIGLDGAVAFVPE